MQIWEKGSNVNRRYAQIHPLSIWSYGLHRRTPGSCRPERAHSIINTLRMSGRWQSVMTRQMEPGGGTLTL